LVLLNKSLGKHAEDFRWRHHRTFLLKLGWDWNLIETLFNQRDFLVIISIPFSRRRLEDKLIWHFNREGSYSAKSGYKIALEVENLDAGDVKQGEWKKPWKLKLPLKIIHFLWRIGHGYFPTKNEAS
jgi:hypothetical protein